MTAKKTTKDTNANVTDRAHKASVSTDTSTVATAGSAQPATGVPVEIAAGDTFDAKVEQCIGYLSMIPIILGSQASPATPLSIEGRRTLPKMKTGAEKEIPAVLNLSDQYGLSLPGGTTAEARADMQRVTTLEKLEARLTSTLLVVQDEIRQAKGRTWKTSRRAYKALAGLVVEIPALQSELDPMASFMATKHKDAPTILRQAEAKTLSKSRATKAKKDTLKAGGGAPTVEPPVVQVAPAVPTAPVAPVVQSPVVAPQAGMTPGNGAGATGPAGGNGTAHS